MFGKLAAGLVLLLSGSAPAQTLLLSEGFNAATMPAGWTTNGFAAGTGSGTDPMITFTNASTRTNVTAFEGTHFVRFNSWDCRSNAQLRLVSPVINALAFSNVSVQFAWHHDTRTDSRDGEGMTLQWTTNHWATTNSVWPFTMRRGPHTGWVERVLWLPPQAASTNLRVGFLFNSAYGNNCYLDAVKVFGVTPINTLPYTETFESGFGAWACGPGADFPWTRHTGLTPSGAFPGQTTGVSSAQSGSYYLYTEASDPNFPSKTAILEAPFSFLHFANPRLEFYYHMCGIHIGSLYVEASTNDGAAWTPLWSKTGPQQSNETDPWALGSVDLSVYAGRPNMRLRFRGVTGSGGLGDLALDSITLTGPCADLDSAVCVSNSAPAAGARVAAGATVTKTWVMSNHSSSAWSSNALYAFAFGRGDNPSSSSVLHFASAESIPPGGTRSFSVTFTVPTNAGTSAGFWSLRKNGTNFGERVWWHVEVDTPDLAITNTITVVPSATTTITLGGTKHDTVIGTMRWTNALTGGTGTFTAANPWSTPGISLAGGDNLITVRGTNNFGVAGAASITITRLTAPLVDVTTPDGSVANAISILAVTGTANSAVIGYLAWTNSLGGSGSIPAAASWTIPDIPLTVGTNIVTVRGTNAAGEVSTDAVSITRQPAGGASTNLIDEPFNNAPAAPAGWSFSGITTNYTSAGSFGRAAPSVKFDDHNDRVTSKTFSNGSNLTFFIRAYPASGTNSVGTFVVEQNLGGSWSTLTVLTNPVNIASTQSVALAGSVTQLRFTWYKTSGNIAFDDVIVRGVMFDPSADTDGDGLPDWWEQFYFDGPISASALEDSDGDGLSNRAEFIAGTHPRDEFSYFGLMNASNAPGGVFYFSWPSATHRVYKVQITADLLVPFSDWSNNIQATPPVNLFQDSPPAGVTSRFYKVNVTYPGAP